MARGFCVCAPDKRDYGLSGKNHHDKLIESDNPALFNSYYSNMI